MTMTSLLNQLPRLQFSSNRSLQTTTTNNNNTVFEGVRDIEDGAAVESHSSSSSQSDNWEQGTAAPNGHIRSRVTGKGRSNSPTQSHSSHHTVEDAFPLLVRQESSDSESSHPPEASTSSSLGGGTPSSPISWLKLFATALFYTTILINCPTWTLESNFFPMFGRAFPGGLSDLIVTPTFDYRPSLHKDGVHIPRIVHVTYKSREELPAEWQDSLKVWEKTHPDWEIRFWSDQDIEAFVHNEFPQYEALHKSYKYTIQRVDSVRYMILYHYGGLYSDMDIYPATSLDKLLAQWEDAGKEVLLAETQNLGVTNAFMASAKGSSFMQCVVENLPNYQHRFIHVIGWQHWEVLSSAGSTYLWGMVGHCRGERHGVEIMAKKSFRGCSVCDAWKKGSAEVETCDTQWLHHSSTNSSWHEHGNWFHSMCFFIARTFQCNAFKACFLTVTMVLLAVRKRKARRARLAGTK